MSDKNEEKEYTVTWTIQVSATSSLEAAKEARDIQLDKESEAVHFDVDGEPIDLLDEYIE